MNKNTMELTPKTVARLTTSKKTQQGRELEAQLRKWLPVGTLVEIGEKRYTTDKNGNARYQLSFMIEWPGNAVGNIISEAIGQFTGQRVNRRHLFPFVTSQMHGADLLEIIGVRLYNDANALKWITKNPEGETARLLTSAAVLKEQEPQTVTPELYADMWARHNAKIGKYGPPQEEADLDQVKALLDSISVPMALPRVEHYVDLDVNGVDPDGYVWQNGKIISAPLPVTLEQVTQPSRYLTASQAEGYLYEGPQAMARMGIIALKENLANIEHAAQRQQIDKHLYKRMLEIHFACLRVLELEADLEGARLRRSALVKKS